jgi:POT family proton-dependent oligopeptide transporter
MSITTHPKALTYLTAAYSFFLTGFAGMIAALVLYQINALHMTSDSAYALFAAAMALIWILPLGGGYLSTKFGYVNAARVGLLFCAVGFAVLCVQRIEALYLGLAFIVVGNGFATPAVWCLVDHCYSKTSMLREAGFTLFYLFFNVGAMVGIFLAGYLPEVGSFGLLFGIDAVCMLAAFFLLHFAEHKITPHKGRSILPQLKRPQRSLVWRLVWISLVATPVSMLLFQNTTINNVLTVLAFIAISFVLARIALQQKNAVGRNKIFAFLFLSFISVLFWIMYSLEPSFLSVFAQTNVDTHWLGLNIPPSSFFAFDCIFVVLIGLILSRLWLHLSKRGINPSLAVKFSLSLIIIGAGFSFLGVVTDLVGGQLVPTGYVVIAYAFFALAELLVSPLGISMVGRLAPEGREGLMMGFWQVATGVGGVAAGYLSMIPKLPSHGEAPSISNPIYSHFFLILGVAVAIAGCAVLPLTKKLRRLMQE